jgi:hypothetical protein
VAGVNECKGYRVVGSHVDVRYAQRERASKMSVDASKVSEGASEVRGVQASEVMADAR